MTTVCVGVIPVWGVSHVAISYTVKLECTVEVQRKTLLDFMRNYGAFITAESLVSTFLRTSTGHGKVMQPEWKLSSQFCFMNV